MDSVRRLGAIVGLITVVSSWCGSSAFAAGTATITCPAGSSTLTTAKPVSDKGVYDVKIKTAARPKTVTVTLDPPYHTVKVFAQMATGQQPMSNKVQRPGTISYDLPRGYKAVTVCFIPPLKSLPPAAVPGMFLGGFVLLGVLVCSVLAVLNL